MYRFKQLAVWQFRKQNFRCIVFSFGSVPIPCEIPQNSFAEAVKFAFNARNVFIRPLHSPHPLSAHGVDGEVLLSVLILTNTI